MKRNVALLMLISVLTLVGCGQQLQAKRAEHVGRNTKQIEVKRDNKAAEEELCNIIQNIDDDRLVEAEKTLPETFGNGEYSIIKRYQEGRMFAKDAEKDELVAHYSEKVMLGTNIETNKDVSTEIEKSDKSIVVFRMSTGCPSCRKLFAEMSKVDISTKKYSPVVLVYKESLDKNPDYMIPENMKPFVKVISKNEELDFRPARVPAVIFLTKDGQLYDIGGCLHPDAIDQKVDDAPIFPEDYTINSELGDK